jgi:epsilon-lactone hydrolase
LISIQARIARWYFRLQNRLHPFPKEIDVERERKQTESISKMFKSIYPVQRQSVEVDGIPGEWHIPAQPVPGRMILYLHGGYYFAGSIRTYQALASNIAGAARSQLLIIDYRLAPEHPFPAALEDALTAYRWLRKTNPEVKQIVVAGDSAGGGLTLALLVALRDQGDPLPAGGVTLSPWTDLACQGESLRTKAGVDFMLSPEITRKAPALYLGGADPRTPYASPLYADLIGLPPLLIQVGSYEILLDDSTRFAERARLAGVEVRLEVWEEMQHVWQIAANIVPESRQAIEHIAQFVEQQAASKVTG